MENIRKIQKLIGVDVGYHNSNIHPVDREGCIGKNGIDKSFTFEKIIEIAYKMENKPNIIIKAGTNAKWYLKRFPINLLEIEINKQKWRDTTRCVMYIIEWDE
jgi:hypothetical protein